MKATCYNRNAIIKVIKIRVLKTNLCNTKDFTFQHVSVKD